MHTAARLSSAENHLSLQLFLQILLYTPWTPILVLLARHILSSFIFAREQAETNALGFESPMEDYDLIRSLTYLQHRLSAINDNDTYV